MTEKICSFCGHHTVPKYEIKDMVNNAITELIEKHGITTFYSEGEGAFDKLCRSTVCKLRKRYPYIQLYKIISYYKPNIKPAYIYNGTIFLGLKRVHSKNDIPFRRRYMAKESSVLLCYVGPDCDDAYDTMRYAEKIGTPVWNLYPEHNRCGS